MGLRISIAEAYRRFQVEGAQEGERCLEAAVAGKAAAKRLPGETPGRAVETTAVPMSTEKAIGAGAEPRAVVQTASGDMPDPQVDAASFYCNLP